jgi:hypothetical protein
MTHAPSRLDYGSRRIAIPPILSNPGIMYNVGNAIAFAGSLFTFVVLSLALPNSSGQGLAHYFLGTAPALLTSVATLVFWVSGMCYANAWARGFPPHPRFNRQGHALSTIGALCIGFALVLMARTEVALALALIATILHVGGKWVSWHAPEADHYFKPMPLYSRVPYVTTVLLDMRSDMLVATSLAELLGKLALPLFLLVATLFWARADWLLLPSQKT